MLKLRIEVRRFANLMEEVLRENDHKKGKKGWKDASFSTLMNCLECEFRELQAAYINRSHGAGKMKDVHVEAAQGRRREPDIESGGAMNAQQALDWLHEYCLGEPYEARNDIHTYRDEHVLEAFNKVIAAERERVKKANPPSVIEQLQEMAKAIRCQYPGDPCATSHPGTPPEGWTPCDNCVTRLHLGVPLSSK